MSASEVHPGWSSTAPSCTPVPPAALPTLVPPEPAHPACVRRSALATPFLLSFLHFLPAFILCPRPLSFPSSGEGSASPVPSPLGIAPTDSCPCTPSPSSLSETSGELPKPWAGQGSRPPCSTQLSGTRRLFSAPKMGPGPAMWGHATGFPEHLWLAPSKVAPQPCSHTRGSPSTHPGTLVRAAEAATLVNCVFGKRAPNAGWFPSVRPVTLCGLSGHGVQRSNPWGTVQGLPEPGPPTRPER